MSHISYANLIYFCYSLIISKYLFLQHLAPFKTFPHQSISSAASIFSATHLADSVFGGTPSNIAGTSTLQMYATCTECQLSDPSRNDASIELYHMYT